MNEYPNINHCVTITSDHYVPDLLHDLVTGGETAEVIEAARGRRAGKTYAAITLLAHNACNCNTANLLYWTSLPQDYIDLVAFPQMCSYLDRLGIAHTADKTTRQVAIGNSTIYFGGDAVAGMRDYEFAVKDEWHVSKNDMMKQSREWLINYGVPEEQLDELIVMAKLARID
jgi:hypothetical protein